MTRLRRPLLNFGGVLHCLGMSPPIVHHVSVGALVSADMSSLIWNLLAALHSYNSAQTTPSG